ncbi:MAG: hypothetical protein JNJ59_24190 [Deltaproteobacteria bacterium]|nr:hypothetical protein [Deltaproteobacteria bacterium]
MLTALKDYGEKMGFGFPDSFNTYLPKSGHEHGANAELAESGDPGKPTPPDARPRKPGRSKARK